MHGSMADSRATLERDGLLTFFSPIREAVSIDLQSLPTVRFGN